MGNVLLYNPTCDIAIANDTLSYLPPDHLRKFESDIGPLMSFIGDSSDFMITDNNAYSGFSEYWNNLGINLPNQSTISKLSSSSLRIDNLQPWGWSKVAHRILKPLKQKCSKQFLQSPVAQWSAEHRGFYSRKTSISFLSLVKEQAASLPFVSIPYQPLVFNSLTGINTWMAANKTPFVLKIPWSSSGRGLYLIPSDVYKEKGQVWIQSRIRQQGEIIVEKWLNRIQDFSSQFYVHTNGQIDCLGINYFETDHEGRFSKEYLGGLSEEKSRSFQKCLPENWQIDTSTLLERALKECAFHHYYNGPIGIDGLIFKDEHDQIKVQPCIEINFRNNMGFLNQQLLKRIHPNVKGIWQIKQFEKNEWNTFARNQLVKKPVQKLDNLIISGFLPLTPMHNDQLFGAWADI